MGSIIGCGIDGEMGAIIGGLDQEDDVVHTTVSSRTGSFDIYSKDYTWESAKQFVDAVGQAINNYIPKHEFDMNVVEFNRWLQAAQADNKTINDAEANYRAAYLDTAEFIKAKSKYESMKVIADAEEKALRPEEQPMDYAIPCIVLACLATVIILMVWFYMH